MDDSNALPSYITQAMQDFQNGLQNNFEGTLPSYLSMAMANPQAQQSVQQQQTPMSQAMAPARTPATPISMAMAQQSGPGMTPLQQMLQTQATDPNQAIGNGALAAGSALLQGKNFMDGLGAAGNAFGNAFDGTLNQQRDLNTPKVTPLPDGSFSMVQLPGQAAQVVSNDQVQQFLLGKAAVQGQIGINKALAVANLTAQRQQDQNDRQQAATYAPKLQVTNQAIETTQRALAEAQRQGDQEPTWSQVQGMVPGVANVMGWDAAQGNNLIQNALVDTQLAQDAQKSGAITDQQARTLGADVPSISSSRAGVLVPFLQRRLEALNRYQSFQQSQVNKGNPTPPQGFATGSGTGDSGGSAGVLTSKSGGVSPIPGNALSYIK